MTSVEGEGRLIDGWIRPLAFPSIQLIPSEPPAGAVEPLDLLKDFCRDCSSDLLERIKERYLRISTPELDIFVVPAEKKILEKIIWPLRSAKVSYCIEDYIGCIALCGMVMEMATIFLYDLIGLQEDYKHLSSSDQKLFETRQYERDRQVDRIRKLNKMGFISKEFQEVDERVRSIRRKYLHILSAKFDNLEEDAFQAYVATFGIAKALVSLSVGNNGKLEIPHRLSLYLNLSGG